jgi:TonB family protein
VVLSALVREDGTTGDVKVTRSLDEEYGLDTAAVRALEQWYFEPGKKDGKPVPVLVAVAIVFRLDDKKP